MNGTSDYSLWTINRFVWLAFGLVSVALAARALRGWLRRTFAVRIDRIHAFIDFYDHGAGRHNRD